MAEATAGRGDRGKGPTRAFARSSAFALFCQFASINIDIVSGYAPGTRLRVRCSLPQACSSFFQVWYTL